MQNSTLSLVIPHSNKSAAVEAQNEGSFKKMRMSLALGGKVHFAYFKERQDAIAL
jgi:hypothetical protein